VIDLRGSRAGRIATDISKNTDQALQKSSGNKTAAAELLGLKRTTLIMKLRSFENLAEIHAV
jgi:DNA-binding NtrC family response regulator